MKGNIMRFTMDFLMDESYYGYSGITFEGIDLGGRCINGDKLPEHWNGWACPAFTKEVADGIAAILNTISDDMGYMEYFDSADGGYYTSVYDDDDAKQCFKSMMIDGTIYYPIGAYSWIWKVA